MSELDKSGSDRIPMSELAEEMARQPKGTQEVVIKVNLEEVERRGGHGLGLAQIDIEDSQGRTARVWVKAYFLQNHVEVSVAYNKSVRGIHGVEGCRSVSKSVSPTFR